MVLISKLKVSLDIFYPSSILKWIDSKAIKFGVILKIKLNSIPIITKPIPVTLQGNSCGLSIHLKLLDSGGGISCLHHHPLLLG
jgi:hypothetical protein